MFESIMTFGISHKYIASREKQRSMREKLGMEMHMEASMCMDMKLKKRKKFQKTTKNATIGSLPPTRNILCPQSGTCWPCWVSNKPRSLVSIMSNVVSLVDSMHFTGVFTEFQGFRLRGMSRLIRKSHWTSMACHKPIGVNGSIHEVKGKQNEFWGQDNSDD